MSRNDMTVYSYSVHMTRVYNTVPYHEVCKKATTCLAAYPVQIMLVVWKREHAIDDAIVYSI